MSARPSSTHRRAETTNEQLFVIFQRNLAGDILSEFATAADKLNQWLQVDKAYYSKARPTVST